MQVLSKLQNYWLKFPKNNVFIIRIGKCKRAQIHKILNSPGPGNYEAPSFVGKGPKIKMAASQRNSKIENYPSPNQYSPLDDYISTRLPKSIIAKGPKLDPDFPPRKIIPSPANYNISRNIFIGPKYKFFN